jgi:hypothetical protein
MRRQDLDELESADATKEALHDWLVLIRAEFEEIPGLRLTQLQVEERWELGAGVVAAILGTLLANGVLHLTPEGAYTRVEPL